MDVESEEESSYTICGTLESEPENALISVHSPLACAMLGKEEADEFSVHLSYGKKSYEVIAISYIDLFSLKKNIRTEKDFGFH